MQYRETPGNYRWLALISCVLISLFFSNSYAAKNAYDELVDHPPIPLADEQGNHVLATRNPYSPKKSCGGGGCHDYEAITHAYHFEMGRDEAIDDYGAKRGLPHLVSPGYYGGYTCMGGSNQQVLAKKNNSNPADFADYGSAGWVKTCMSCHAGGGWAEKDREGIRYDQKKVSDIRPLDGDYFERVFDEQTGEERFELWDWKKSGVGEADCLYCHIKFSTLKLPEDSGLNQSLSPRNARGALVEKGFFRQAATGLMEYVKNNNGDHLVSIARTNQEFALDTNGLPVFNWNAEAFDENGRVVISMLRFPENENCMECHLTSNSRRGFYGFGEDAKATLATDGGDEVEGAGATLEDDYRDDVHKGTNYKADNGEKRSIESCNSCHSNQYYKPLHFNVDLDADHNFPKGNSDMDVRNDLDYRPNVFSCEKCHINSVNAVVRTEHSSLLESHQILWKASGQFTGHEEDTLTQITQKHFDVVACQTCHILGKKDGNGNDFKIMYRYRTAEDGKFKIIPYNPRLRFYWKDKTSGRVLVKSERDAIFKKAEDANGSIFAEIVDPMSQEVLGRVSAKVEENEFSYDEPDSYEGIVAAKKAYDSLLRKKGYNNVNTTMIWTESNEYVISHNTRPASEAMACNDCHLRDQSGKVTGEISPEGILGTSHSKVVTTIPDNRLVSEGIITIGLPYNKLQPGGEITQNSEDILRESIVDPFMSLLKNASVNETIGKFQRISRNRLASLVKPQLAELMSVDFPSQDAFIFFGTKGDFTLRNMAAAIDGNTINTLLFPRLHGVLGLMAGAERGAQDLLNARSYGQLRSDVFYFEVRDEAKKHVSSFNGASMYVKAIYRGTKTDINDINVVVANWALDSIRTLPASDLMMVQPTKDLANGRSVDGFVVFKITEPGYFVVADR